MLPSPVSDIDANFSNFSRINCRRNWRPRPSDPATAKKSRRAIPSLSRRLAQPSRKVSPITEPVSLVGMASLRNLVGLARWSRIHILQFPSQSLT
jgi:hypothetical protein